MAEATELETETNQSPEEAAEVLRHLADELADCDDITVEGNHAMMTVPGASDEITTELEAIHEIGGKYDQVAVEIELDWTIVPEDGGGDHES